VRHLDAIPRPAWPTFPLCSSELFPPAYGSATPGALPLLCFMAPVVRREGGNPPFSLAVN